MGVTFVLLLWAVVGSALALVGSTLLRAVVNHFFPGSESHRHARRFVVAFPFLCLGWAGAVFLFHAIINVAVFHRDIGLGDSFECPLPDGYALTAIDTTDIASVNKDGYGGLSGVRSMQLSGRYILAATDSKYFEHFADSSAPVDDWYILDTTTGQSTAFTDIDALRIAARRLHIDVSLRPVSAVYSQYQFTWFDWIAGLILLGLPAAVAALLVRYFYRMIRNPSREKAVWTSRFS